MEARRIVFVLIGVLGFLWSSFSQAETQASVIINEIAWMGTAVSANDEWIELKNTTDKTISLKGWTLKNADGKINVSFRGQIPPQGFYLLERTDDNSVVGTKADIIYKGSLRNSGDLLELYKGTDIIIDSAAFTSSWPAGNNDTKQTMERTADSWQTSKDVGGTPKAANSIIAALKKEGEGANNIISKNAPAMISGGNNPWLLFLIALTTTIIAGGIILAIKFKFLNHKS